MISFLFPEDLRVASAPPSQQSPQKPETHGTSPAMPSRLPPRVPNLTPPSPPPIYTTPPVPAQKNQPAISITELNTNNPSPDIKRTKSKRSLRAIASLSHLRGVKEARAVAERENVPPKVDIVLPPLSPVVDDEFWRTGKYPTSPGGGGMAFVAF